MDVQKCCSSEFVCTRDPIELYHSMARPSLSRWYRVYDMTL